MLVLIGTSHSSLALLILFKIQQIRIPLIPSELSYLKFSKIIGVWNKVYHITPEELWEHIPKIQYYMDEPLADASCAALYFLKTVLLEQF